MLENPSPDLLAIRSDLATFVKDMGLEYYTHNSGQKDKLEIASIFERFGHLFSKDLAEHCLARWQSAESGEDARSYKHLHQFAFSGYIGNLVKGVIEEMSAKQNSMSIDIRGDKIGYHSLAPRLMNEPDAAIRREIDEAQAALEFDLNKLRREKWRLTFQAYREFGYGSYLEGCEKVSEVDFGALSASLQDFLETTEEKYSESFDKLCQQRLGYPLDKASRCDLGFLLRANEWDSLFPKDGMVEKATRFLHDLGMPLADTPAIKTDLVDREKKRPRAFCSPVRLGKEVYICTRPAGGMSDYLTFLHELGHAYHFAYADSALPSELTMVGDSATSEIFAFNFNYLGADPLWLQTYVGIENPAPIVDFLRLQKLYMLRRYASKFLYEIELHKDFHIDGRAPMYDRYLTDALKAQHRWEYWLSDLDDAFYSAGYLRAWIFEVQLREYFQGEFAADWWRDPAAGHELRDLWKSGRMYMPEEISETLFGEPLDLAPITRELMAT